MISEHRSSIVFANSRRLAERLTAHLNELNAERLGVLPSVPTTSTSMAQSGASSGRDGSRGPVIARAHRRSARSSAQIEDDLKTARCRALSRRRRRSSGSIWVPSASWCRSRLHRRWPAGCSGSVGQGIMWGRHLAGCSFPTIVVISSHRRSSSNGCGKVRSRRSPSSAIHSTCWPSRSSRSSRSRTPRPRSCTPGAQGVQFPAAAVQRL